MAKKTTTTKNTDHQKPKIITPSALNAKMQKILKDGSCIRQALQTLDQEYDLKPSVVVDTFRGDFTDIKYEDLLQQFPLRYSLHDICPEIVMVHRDGEPFVRTKSSYYAAERKEKLVDPAELEVLTANVTDPKQKYVSINANNRDVDQIVAQNTLVHSLIPIKVNYIFSDTIYFYSTKTKNGSAGKSVKVLHGTSVYYENHDPKSIKKYVLGSRTPVGKSIFTALQIEAYRRALWVNHKATKWEDIATVSAYHGSTWETYVNSKRETILVLASRAFAADAQLQEYAIPEVNEHITREQLQAYFSEHKSLPECYLCVSELVALKTFIDTEYQNFCKVVFPFFDKFEQEFRNFLNGDSNVPNRNTITSVADKTEEPTKAETLNNPKYQQLPGFYSDGCSALIQKLLEDIEVIKTLQEQGVSDDDIHELIAYINMLIHGEQEYGIAYSLHNGNLAGHFVGANRRPTNSTFTTLARALRQPLSIALNSTAVINNLLILSQKFNDYKGHHYLILDTKVFAAEIEKVANSTMTFSRMLKNCVKGLKNSLLTDSKGFPIHCDIVNGSNSDAAEFANKVEVLSNNNILKDAIIIIDSGLITEPMIKSNFSNDNEDDYVKFICNLRTSNLRDACVDYLKSNRNPEFLEQYPPDIRKLFKKHFNSANCICDYDPEDKRNHKRIYGFKCTVDQYFRISYSDPKQAQQMMDSLNISKKTRQKVVSMAVIVNDSDLNYKALEFRSKCSTYLQCKINGVDKIPLDAEDIKFIEKHNLVYKVIERDEIDNSITEEYEINDAAIKEALYKEHVKTFFASFEMSKEQIVELYGYRNNIEVAYRSKNKLMGNVNTKTEDSTLFKFYAAFLAMVFNAWLKNTITLLPIKIQNLKDKEAQGFKLTKEEQNVFKASNRAVTYIRQHLNDYSSLTKIYNLLNEYQIQICNDGKVISHGSKNAKPSLKHMMSMFDYTIKEHEKRLVKSPILIKFTNILKKNENDLVKEGPFVQRNNSCEQFRTATGGIKKIEKHVKNKLREEAKKEMKKKQLEMESEEQ